MAELKTKDDLIKLVNQAEFLDVEKKQQWMEIAENFNQSQIDESIAFFENAKLAEIDNKFTVLVKAGLGDVYKAKITEISNKYRNNARKKEEAFISSKEESPEDILKKLSDK